MRKISERLKEEREAAELSQQALADRCGISLRSQQNYEKGDRSPDAEYLARLAENGLDVLYILTGQRGQSVNAQAVLPESDRILLSNFHAAPEQVQAGVKTALGAFAPAGAGKRKSKAA